MKVTFQNFVLPELGETSPTDRDLHQWIKFNRFTSAQLIGNVWHLEAYSEPELFGAFTPDFQRFSFSSFESFSLANLERERCSSVGWPLLKLYYSAFFAAHAITRATGNGHVNLDGDSVKSVNNYLSAVGESNELNSGSYKVSVIENFGRAYLTLESSSQGGGVHDSFWKYFCSFLDKLANEAVQKSLPSANEFLRETSALKSCISDSGKSGVWFSATRNAINYRHEFDCWLPHDKKSPIRKLSFPNMLGDPDSMEHSLSERQDELARLINLSTYLSSMSYHLILGVGNKISGNSPFIRKWNKLKTAIS